MIGVVAKSRPGDLGYALMAAAGLALSAPFAVATAAPSIGALFARLGIGRIPEETEPPAALLPLHLPVVEALRPPTLAGVRRGLLPRARSVTPCR